MTRGLPRLARSLRSRLETLCARAGFCFARRGPHLQRLQAKRENAMKNLRWKRMSF